MEQDCVKLQATNFPQSNLAAPKTNPTFQLVFYAETTQRPTLLLPPLMLLRIRRAWLLRPCMLCVNNDYPVVIVISVWEVNDRATSTRLLLQTEITRNVYRSL